MQSRTLNPSDRPSPSLGCKDDQRQRCDADPYPRSPEAARRSSPSQRQPLRTQQQESVKMSVNRKDTGENVSHTPPPRRFLQSRHEKAARERSQEHKQRIAPRFLRVADGIGVATQQRHRDQSNAPVEHLTG